MYLTIFVTLLFLSTVTSAHTPPEATTEKQLLALGLSPEEIAWLKKHPVLRVGGSSAFEPKLIKSNDGSFSGIMPDFFNLLGERLGIQFEMVDDTCREIKRRITDKDIDIIGIINRGVAKKRGLLTQEGAYSKTVTVFARKDRQFTITQDSDISKLRVAYYKRVLAFKGYLEEHKGEIETIATGTPLEAMKLLLDGKVDVVVGFNHDSYLLFKNLIWSLEPIYEFQQLASDSVIGIRPDAPLLSSILAKTIASLSSEERNEIKERWSWTHKTTNARKTLELTKEEQEWIKQHPKIQFGIDTSWQPYIIPQQEGPAKGLDVDLLNKINALTGTNIELVAGIWSELVEQANNKEISGLAQSSNVPEREKYFNFTDTYLSHYFALSTTPEKKKEFLTADDLHGKKVALQKGSAWIKEFLKSFDDIQIVEGESELDAFNLVVEGKADVAVTSLTVYTRLRAAYGNTFQIAHILKNDPLKVVYSIRKDWPELQSIINKALAVIGKQELEKLYEKWAGVPLTKYTQHLSFTDKEKKWLRQDHTVRVRVTDYPPFQFIGEKGPMGISVDFLRLIGERTGVNFDFISETRPCKEAFNGMITQQGPDLMQCIKHSPKRRSQLSVSKAFFSSPRVIYTPSSNISIHGIEDLENKTVAVTKQSFVSYQLTEDFPLINLQLHDTDKQALEAVAFGNADAYIGNLALGTFLISKHGMNNIKVAAPSSLENHRLPFANRYDWPELSSIINKGLESLSPVERANIRNKYISIRYEQNESTDILKWLLIIGSTAAAIVLLFVLWSLSLKKQVHNQTLSLENINKYLKDEISARKLASQNLAKSEEKYRHLADNAVVGIAISTIAGDLLYVNDAMVKLFEFDSPEEMISEGMLSRWANLDDRVQFISDLRAYGQVNNCETEAITKNGNRIHALFTSSLHNELITGMVLDITDKKKTELALIKSEHNFRATFEHSNIGIAHVAPDKYFIRVNDKICQMLGYSQEEMLKISIREVTHPDDIESDLRYYQQMVTGERETFSSDKRLICKSGEYTWIHLTVSLMRNEEGEPLFFVGTTEDISYRIQTEAALKESEQLFRVTFDQTALGFAHVAPNGQILRANQQFSKIIGYSQKELLGMTIKDMNPVDNQEHNFNKFKQLIEGEKNSFSQEKQLVTKKGDLIWVNLTATLLRDENAQPLFVVGTIQDITSRKHSDELLKESEDRFRMIYENAPIMIDSFDENGRCTMWNKECEKVFGWTREENFSHDNPLELFYPEPQVRQQVLESVLETPDTVFREWQPKTKDGSTCISLWANYKLPDHRIMSIGYDITERKATDKMLHEYQQKLKSLSIQLTLAEEQERRRIAADLHDNVGQSLALTRLQLATARKSLPNDHKLSEEFEVMSQSLLKIIQDTRDLIFELSSPSLNELGLGVAIDEWMHGQMAEKYDIKTKLIDHASPLNLDKDLRAMLFRNVRELLINTIKHAKAKSVSVTLEYDNHQLDITVQDDGIGFDHKQVLSDNDNHNGFGLFSVQERMFNLGGELKIASTIGVGSTFTLHLPINPENHNTSENHNVH